MDLVKSKAGLVNIESKIRPWAKTPFHPYESNREGYCVGSNFWSLRQIILSPIRIEGVKKLLINVKVIAARSLEKSMGVLPRHSKWFVTMSYEMIPQTHLEWKGFSFLHPDNKKNSAEGVQFYLHAWILKVGVFHQIKYHIILESCEKGTRKKIEFAVADLREY